MLKKVLFAAAICGFAAGVALPVQPVQAARNIKAFKTAAGAPLTCKEAAKLKFPSDLKSRHAFKHECKVAFKTQHKAAKAAA
jgi:hypothetical protein